MAKIQTGLGKGLSALISDVNAIQRSSEENKPQKSENSPLLSTSEIDIDRIEPNPYQPRREFNEELLMELAQSIKTLGLIQPITVRPIGGSRFQIISGERRFRACKIAGIKTIPAYIKNADDNGMLEMAIVENVQREDLDSIEIALSFQRLIDECNLTQEDMAIRVGKKRATVTNYLRMLKLPAEIQFAIRAKRLSMGHAKAILGLEGEKAQLKLANMIIEKEMSVRETETKVQKINAVKEKKEIAEEEETPSQYFRVIDILGKYFDNNISVKRSEKGSGIFTLHFKNDKQVEIFLNALEESGLCSK
jgi:ParB family transcriptional regulator, chromosome partitioning protein